MKEKRQRDHHHLPLRNYSQFNGVRLLFLRKYISKEKREIDLMTELTEDDNTSINKEDHEIVLQTIYCTVLQNIYYC